MCKIKPYTPQMDERMVTLSLRFDFYSMPDFRDAFVQEARRIFKMKGFSERLLTEYERQMIDIDSVCGRLDILIDEVVGKKVYKLEGLECQEAKMDLFVSPYFVYIVCERSENGMLIPNMLYPVAELLGKCRDNIDVQNVALAMNYQVATETLWSIFDKDAFPVFDENTMITGRYADSHQYEDVVVELVRDVRVGKYELGDGTVVEPYYYFNIMSVGSYKADESFFEGDVAGKLSIMYQRAQDEATKCFV